MWSLWGDRRDGWDRERDRDRDRDCDVDRPDREVDRDRRDRRDRDAAEETEAEGVIDAEYDADGEETDRDRDRDRDRVDALSDPDSDTDADAESESESDDALREDRLDGAVFAVAGVAGGVTRIGGFVFVFETTEKSSRYEDRGTKHWSQNKLSVSISCMVGRLFGDSSNISTSNRNNRDHPCTTEGFGECCVRISCRIVVRICWIWGSSIRV